MAASLADGKVEGGRVVVCFMHGWKFDLTTGAGAPPAKSWACARVYDVRVENGRVLLRRGCLPAPDGEPGAGEAD
jgi:nitrite reductase/ring-hydroxylating ferredoxin subunit